MAEIKLPNTYYVDCTPKNYRLCERYNGKTKTGEQTQSVRRHGNHSSLQGALEEFLSRNVLNGLQAVEIWEVGKLVEHLNKMAVYKLESILEATERDKVE